MKRKTMKTSVLTLLICLSITLFSSSSIATTTYWWKIAPSTCTINAGNNDPSQVEHNNFGKLYMDDDPGEGGINAYCPIILPEDATMNLLRVRTFTTNGLPSNTNITVALKRVSWSNSQSILATADLDPSDSYDDVSFSSAINNEDYMYLLDIYMYKNISATSEPELNMIEIRYTRP